MNENIRLEWFKPDLTAPLEVPLMDSGVHAGFPSPADDSIEQPLGSPESERYIFRTCCRGQHERRAYRGGRFAGGR